MSEALRCAEVTVRYESDDPPVLCGLSFAVEDGERVALVGLNGTGKTTLLMSIVGLVPHEGQISVCGEALNRKNVTALRRRTGFLFNVPEDQLLFPKVAEDVAFGLLQVGMKAAQAYERVDRILESLGIGSLAGLPLHHLSHGQKQRVALAGALVTEPELLLLDEPTAGLDPVGKRELAKLLIAQRSAQLIATHDLDFADQVCSRVIFLEGGTIAATTENTDEIRNRWNLR